MVGSRPDEFATLDDAMAYRRAASPVVAGRSAADQRELALGVLRQRPDGEWGWKMDPAYIRQRVERGAPVRPNLWPTLARLACPTLVVWGTDSDVLSEAQARRMVETLPKGKLWRSPGSGMRRAWSSRPRSPVSKVSCLPCSLQRAPRVPLALAPVDGSRAVPS